MVNCLGKFIPNLTDMTEPLKNLTKDKVPYIWSDNQEMAFNEVKQAVT